MPLPLKAMLLTLGVWCWRAWRDDCDGLHGRFGRLRWLGPGRVPGQEPRHLALDLAKDAPQSPWRVDLLDQLNSQVGQLADQLLKGGKTPAVTLRRAARNAALKESRSGSTGAFWSQATWHIKARSPACTARCA
jgi:hypothetical protein